MQLQNYEPPAYKKSVIIHLVAISSFFIYQVLQFNFSKPMEIPEAIHVDLVGLPDEVVSKTNVTDFTTPLKQEEKVQEAQAKEKEVVEVPKKQAEVEKPKIETAMDAIKRFKEEAKKKAAKEEASAPKKEVKKLKSLAAREEIEKAAQGSRRPVFGNVVSQGNSMSGDISSDPGQGWGRAATAEVAKSWELPEHLLQSGLKATAVIHVASDGRVTNYYITHSSGNEEFDAQVKQALARTTFVPPPPEAAINSALRDGVILRFPMR